MEGEGKVRVGVRWEHREMVITNTAPVLVRSGLMLASCGPMLVLCDVVHCEVLVETWSECWWSCSYGSDVRCLALNKIILDGFHEMHKEGWLHY